MKKKTIIITTGFLIVGAAATSGIVAGVLSTRTKEPETKIDINEEVKKVTADYNDKNLIESNKIDINNIKFSKYNTKEYEVIIKKYEVSKTDNTKILVHINLKYKNSNEISEDFMIEIKGFKKTKTQKDELNEVAKKINETDFVYEDGKENTPVEYIEKEKIKINNFPKEISYIITSVDKNKNDDTKVSVKFTVNNEISNIKSDEVSIEISGFKSVESEIKTLDEIGKAIKVVDYKGDKSKQETTNLDKSLFSFDDLRSEYEAKIVSITPKTNNTTTAVIEFTINKKNKTIKSNQISIEVSGFKRQKTQKELLNEELSKLTVSYTGDKRNVEVSSIPKTSINITGVGEKYQAIVERIEEKTDDKSTAVIVVVVKNLTGNEKSDEKKFELKGFKVQIKTQEQLNEQANQITVEAEDKDIKLSTTYIDLIKLKFSNHDKNILVTDIVKSKKEGSDSVLIVKFKIQEKDGSIKSQEISKEIDGFRTKAKTRNEINQALNKAKISFSGNIAQTEVKKINRNNLKLDNLSSIYEIVKVVIRRISSNNRTANILLTIKEKGENVESEVRPFTIFNFKVPSTKVQELDDIAKKLVITYKDMETTVLNTLDDFKKEKLIYSGIDTSKYDVVIDSLMILTARNRRVQLYVFIREKSTKEESNVFQININNFKEK